MILPAGINTTWLTTTELPAKEFGIAQSLHFKEEFLESNYVLKNMFRPKLAIIGRESVPAYKALVPKTVYTMTYKS